MRNRLLQPATLLFLILCLPVLALAQAAVPDKQCSPTGPQNLTDYVEGRICENLRSRVDQTDPTKQAAPPAAAANSTSLVERSSAPDLLGFGLDFLNLSDKAAGDKKSATPKTLTFSAYALRTKLAGKDPLDPKVYNDNAKWRSVSFTVGYDVPENSNDRDPVIGIKWLAYNGRDVSSKDNRTEIGKIQEALKPASRNFAAIDDDVRIYLFTALQKRSKLPAGVVQQSDFDNKILSPTDTQLILDSLTDDEKKNIDRIILKYINAFRTLDVTTRNAVQAIRTRPQLALSFTTTQRKGKRPDEYAGTLTFDKGMGTNSLSINGSFIMKRNGIKGKDSNGGQFAAAIHLPLNGFNPLAYRDPMLFSLEANGTAMTGTAPIFKAQAKLTIPIIAGMEIPISVSVANRTEFVKEKEVKGKFGFTFDVSKALKAFRDNFVKIQ